MRKETGFILAFAFVLMLPILATHINGAGQPPISHFVYSPTAPGPGESILFNASGSYDPDGIIVNYTWDLGDGSTVTATNPTITYSYPVDGNYTVQLTVTDDEGLTGVSATVVQVQTVIFFRTTTAGLTPLLGVMVTVYYQQGSSWVPIPASSGRVEIKYDNMTQPDLANTDQQRYRNPGYTAYILRKNASNIGFDLHEGQTAVFFKFQWGPYVMYWPNDTTTVYNYNGGTVETNSYLPGHGAYWDATAGTYVISINDIPGHGVSPSESHPIIVKIPCPIPPQQYYLTVQTSPSGITTIPGGGWYNNGTSTTLTAPQAVDTPTGTHYRFDYWDVDGASKGKAVNPIPVTMTTNHTATAHYVLQYPVVFNYTGLDSSANGAVITANGTSYTFTNLPYTLWADSGSSVTYSYSSTVSSSTTGKRFRLQSTTGPSSPITVSGPKTVTGNYAVQYLIAFLQTGLDSTASGTVVTVNGTAKTYTDLPFNWWIDSGSTVTYSYSSIVSSTVSGKQFRLTGVHCPPSQFVVVGEPETITGSYCTQYQVTFGQSGLDSTASGTVVTVNGTAKTYGNLPYSFWVDSGSSVTYSYNSPISTSYSNKRFRLNTVTGPTSPITVAGPATVTGNYVTQYSLTFTQTKLDSSATGTVVTVNGNSKAYGDLPYTLWADSGSSVTYSYSSTVSSSTTGKQFRLNTVSGLSSPITVSGSSTITGNYVTQYLATFAQTGLTSDATGTVVTVSGNAKTYTNLPYSLWVDSGSSITYSYSSTVSSTTGGKQFRLGSVSGSSSPITVTAPATVTGNYVTQYQVTFAQTGLDSTASGTVVTVNGTAKTYGNLPYSFWVDSGSSVTYSYNSSVSSSVANKQFRLSSISGPSSPIVVSSVITVTGNYAAQYPVTFAQTSLDSSATSTVVTVNGNAKTYGNLPYSFWVDSGSSVTYSYSLTVSSTTSGKQFRLSGVTGPSSPITVSGPVTVTGNYVIQYQVIFSHTGLTLDATGTVVTANGNAEAYANLPYGLWVDNGSSVTYLYSSVVSSSTAGKQFMLSSVSGFASPIKVTAPATVTGNYKTQYQVTFAQSGLDSSASGTVVTVNGTAKTYGNLPYSFWVDSGSSVTYSYSLTVSSTTSGKQFRLSTTSGPSSPTIVSGATTVTGNYVTQYSVTFAQTGLDSSATGTVLTVNGNAKTYTGLSYSFWVDSGSSITYSYSSLVSSGTSGKQFRLNTVSGPSSPITVSGSTTVTGNYVTQYLVTFTYTGLDSSATGTVVTVNGNAEAYVNLPYGLWADNGSSVTYSYNSIVSSSISGKQFKLNGVSGLSSPITASSAVTVTGNYVTQYQVTFTHTGLDSSATGTIVTVNGNAKTFTDLPFTIWVNSSSSVTYSYSNVPSSTTGKTFVLTGVTGPASPITVTGPVTVTGNYKTQYKITFDQTGVGTDYIGTVVTVDGTNYNTANLPTSFWWDQGSSHNFAFASPLIVNSSRQYGWSSTTGLTSLQSGALTITTSGSVTGNYIIQNYVTFDQQGVSAGFTGTVVIIDGTSYNVSALPISFYWSLGSTHNFAFQSPLIVTANSKQHLWTSTTGLSTSQSGSITVTSFGSVVGHYKTQYYVTLATNPPGLGNQSGSAWYDDGAYVSISTDQYLPGGSRWRFAGWTTADMSEIADPTSPSTTVLIDTTKTVTANYIHQYYVTFMQSGLTSDASGTVATVNGTALAYSNLPYSTWVDTGSIVNYAYATTLPSTTSGKQFSLTTVTGPPSPITVGADTNITANYKIQYYLSVSSPYGSAGGQGWYDSGVSAYATLDVGLVDHLNGTRHVFTNWNGDASGTNYVQSDPITMNGPKNAVANWKTQHCITFSQSGLDPSASGTVVTVNTVAKTYSDLSYYLWVDSGSSVTYSYSNVSSSTPGKTFILTSVTGPVSPVTVTSPTTVTGNYKIQYQVTFNQSGVGPDFTGTVVMIDSNPYALGSLSVSFWWDSGSIHAFAYQSPLTVSPSTNQYVWTSTAGLSTLQSDSITVTNTGSVTGSYKTQYFLSVSSSYGVVGGQGWYDSGVTAYATLNVGLVDHLNGTRHVFTNWNGDASGTNYAQSDPITMNGAKAATAQWKTQYCTTFAQSGLDSSASGTVATVNSVARTYSDLPYYLWADSGSIVTYSYGNVSSSTSGERFILTGMTGPASPITLTSPATVTGNYKTQYQVTFGQSGVGSDFTGTIVTIDSNPYTFSSLSVPFWWDSGSSHTFAYQSPLTVSPSTNQYVWTSTAGLSILQSDSITVSNSGSVTGSYKTQYCLSVSSSYGVVGGQGWYDSGATAYATLNVGLVDHANGTRHAFTSWSGDASGTNYVQSDPITMNGVKAATAQWKTQYSTTFTQSGLDSSASGTIVTVNGTSAAFSGLPHTVWADSGDTLAYTYTSSVPSTNTGQAFALTSVSGPSSPATVTNPATITGNYKTQYQVTFGQSGVGSDFTGAIVTIDGTSYNGSVLPAVFWWDSNSAHAFSYVSPLIVNISRQYNWASTTGLSTLQSDTLNITGSGSVTGNYATETKYQVTFSQTGLNSDFTGNVIIIDGSNYNFTSLIASFWWDAGSNHTFAYQSPLIVSPSTKQYILTSMSGPSSPINVSGTTAVTGNYKTQYYLNMATSPSGVPTPTGAGWYDSGSNATISTQTYIDITPSLSRYRFNGWTTLDMTEITSPTSWPTTVLMDKGKTVTATYATQYNVTFKQLGFDSDFTGTILTIDGINYSFTGLPHSFWWDSGSNHTFAYQSPLIVSSNSKQYVWTSTTGLSTSQSGSITASAPDDPIGTYKTQYFLNVSSSYGTVGGQGWYDSGVTAYATLNVGVVDHGNGTRHVFTNWNGDASGTNYAQSDPITMNGAKAATAQWKAQQFLTLVVLPSGVASISGQGWYDTGMNVLLTAPTVPGQTFSEWRVDGSSQGSNVTSITVMMDTPRLARAYYGEQTEQEGATPVGGYSFLPANATPQAHLAAYFTLVAMLGVAMSLLKRKRK